MSTAFEQNNAAGLTIRLTGRVDSNNAAMVEEMIAQKLAGRSGVDITLDAEELDYISSAGLRVLLRLRSKNPGLRVINVSPEVYEIFDMTGFTEMMTVEKAYRVISVEGCEVIGEGQNGKVYRIDGDMVVKTYKNADALGEIRHEREVAKLALILGVPTAISYDVVRVGDSYGSVFELLNARSFAKILAEEPERMDWCVDEYVKMLRTIHGISVPAGKLPSIKDKHVKAAANIRGCLPAPLGDKLIAMMGAIPDSDRMIHGDYHTKNIVLVNGEILLIDMDTLSVGDPVFELAQMYNSYIGFYEADPESVLAFQGFGPKIAGEFWRRSLCAYIGAGEEAAARMEDRIRCVAYTRLIDRNIRHGLGETPAFALWIKEISELLERVDTLTLDIPAPQESGADELVIAAEVSNLSAVNAFVDERLEAAGCSFKAQTQIDVAVEEIFVNIASYAYAPGTGDATIRMSVEGDPATAVIVFSDRGTPYDPLAHEDPDVTLPAEQRGIGGLGIFMTKKLMDDVAYEYKDGCNVLTLRKKL